MIKRTITGAIVVVLVYAWLFFSHIPLVIHIGTVLLGILAVFEILRICKTDNPKNCYAAMMLSVLLLILPIPQYEYVMMLILPVALILFGFMMAGKEQIRDFSAIFATVVSVAVVLLFKSIPTLREWDNGFYYLTFAVTACFVTDVAALLFGKVFGLRRLCPKISPKKTVEGAVGGVICTVLIAAIAAVLLDKYEILRFDTTSLINEGARVEDLSASIFQAVVNQTISGLACGKPIRGNVAFLGGPLHFMPELKKAFIRTLKLTPEHIVDPENSHLFAAMGAALEAKGSVSIDIDQLQERLSAGVQITFEMPRLDPLFTSKEAYNAFTERHARAVVPKGELSSYNGDCFLGIDAGSTTTKMVLIGSEGELLFSFYASNQGDPIKTAIGAIAKLKEQLPERAKIVRSCSTGYGEALLKSAFSLDEGEVETIAHCTAAAFFDKDVDCVLDIGGQDMKCIKLKNGAVDTILLNEACSSGCGSFIENFANSLGYSAEDFSIEALYAKAPVDLGTRCTVFMNSNVKQAQKEGATVSDISAGLAYSVIKNALFKVIKLADAKDLGEHIVVQGGTFHNRAVLRAFEQIAGVEATCPDIAGLMGAFGAALIAKSHYRGQATRMLPLDEILKLTYTSKSRRCGGCSNNCMLTVNRFSNERSHVTGNRCEKGIGELNGRKKAPNMVLYKRKRIFNYPPLEEKDAPRGIIGIPRVLNMYENYPYWATFFKKLGFRVILSPWSDRRIYELGMDSIPSESECYPAKLSHGHVQWLINQGIQTIFHPCIYYEHQEIKTAQNHYNCPIVVSYAENLKNNVEAITRGDVRLVRPFMAFTSEKIAADRLVKICREEWNVPEKEVRDAASAAWQEQQKARFDIRAEGARILDEMEKNGTNGIVLAGRPYHIDPEINQQCRRRRSRFSSFTARTTNSFP